MPAPRWASIVSVCLQTPHTVLALTDPVQTWCRSGLWSRRFSMSRRGAVMHGVRGPGAWIS